MDAAGAVGVAAAGLLTAGVLTAAVLGAGAGVAVGGVDGTLAGDLVHLETVAADFAAEAPARASA